MKLRIALALTLGLHPMFCVQVFAHDSELQVCARIVNVVDRLDCYDALAAEQGAGVASPPAPPATPTLALTPAPAAPAAVTAPAAANANAVVPAVPATTIEDDFGFEWRRLGETPDEIRSRYDGEFAGWSGKTLFKLENGQVWKQNESSRLVLRRHRPIVTIRKGAFGTFRLTVEGARKSVSVKRIK